MAITLEALRFLVETVGESRSGGRALTFGVQDVFVTPAQLAAELPGLPPKASTDDILAVLGFDAIESLDIDASTGPTHVHDMNLPLPAALGGRYDLALDGGTFEHIFNIGQALFNAAAILKIGGVAIHVLPMNNQVNHGFYQVCPTLLFDFYRANGFTDLRLGLFEEGRLSLFGSRDIISPALSRTPFLFFHARKAEQRPPATPMQAMYARDTEGLDEALSGTPFYVWGVGGGFRETYAAWLETRKDSLPFLGFIDGNEKLHGTSFMGFPVFSPDELAKGKAKAVLVASTYWPEIVPKALSMDPGLRFVQ